MSRARKHDNGKPQMHLQSPVARKGLVAVLAFGAKKYNKHNWRKGLLFTQLYDAVNRHLDAFICGEDTDNESALSHIDHAAANLMFWSHYIHEDKRGLDDRFKELKKSKKQLQHS